MDHAVLNLGLTRHGLELITGNGTYTPDDRRRDDLNPALLVSGTSDAFAFKALQPDPPQPGQPFLQDLPNSMYRRLDILGEEPIFGRPHSWRSEWLTNTPIHAIAWISGPLPGINAVADDVIDRFGVHQDVFVIPGLSLNGRRPRGSVDPFGFKDGVSQPAIEGFHDPWEIVGRGAWTGEGWRGLKPGEFVIGEEDEGNERRRPLPGDMLHNATFLVFRQIEMWPDRLDDLQDAESLKLGVAPDEIGEWLVGRNRPRNGNDGTSLMIEGSEEDLDFIYGFDPEGLKCPLGAHVRRSNPRDALGKSGGRTNRHRIIRRGMPYIDRRGAVRGLAFIALQARIEDQFEFIQARWLNSGPTLHVGQDPDPIAGVVSPGVDRPRFVKQGAPARVIPLPRDRPLTEVRGGEYFMLPALPALRAMAGL